MRWGSHALAAAVLLLVSLAEAQGPGGADPRRGGATTTGARPSGTPPGNDQRAPGPNLAELVHMRLSQLEEDLNLRPEQRALWNAYRERVLRMLDDVRRSARTITASGLDATGPRRLDALADGARNRLTAIEEIVDAGKALYASLTPEQQAIADRRLALPLATLTGSEPAAGDPRRPAGGPASVPVVTPGSR
jgi:hypothetical protein